MIWHPRPRWEREGRDWPNRDASRWVSAAGLDWHVQVAGDGPVLLLLHGTGAATHSWRRLLPLLAGRYRVVAPDLPGHGFTRAPPGPAMSLPSIARLIAELVDALDAPPVLAVGHSAGAAILIRMTLDGSIRPRALVAINGALGPFRGLAGHLFPAMAKALHWNPLAAGLMSTVAVDPNTVPLLIRSTGSAIPIEDRDRYARLFRHPGHVAATLAMMAHWDLVSLEADLARLDVPLTLLVGARDLAVPPAEAARIAARVPGARVERLEALGHLAHEEDPEAVAERIFAADDRAHAP